MTNLSEVRKNLAEAEDRHGRVFATACTILNTQPNGKDLVTAWLACYREMQLLRKTEMELTANGKYQNNQDVTPSSEAPRDCPICLLFHTGPCTGSLRGQLATGLTGNREPGTGNANP